MTEKQVLIQDWFHEWLDRYPLNSPYYARNAAANQIMWVRDQLGAFGFVTVVSSHTSKSVELPVYRIQMKDRVVTMRCNFFNWIVSVQPIDDAWVNGPEYAEFILWWPEDAADLHPVYAEGFKDEWVFPMCSHTRATHQPFTVALNQKEQVWMLLSMMDWRGRL